MFKYWLRGDPEANRIGHEAISAYLASGAFTDKLGVVQFSPAPALDVL
jgi:hypothetical protein